MSAPANHDVRCTSSSADDGPPSRSTSENASAGVRSITSCARSVRASRRWLGPSARLVRPRLRLRSLVESSAARRRSRSCPRTDSPRPERAGRTDARLDRSWPPRSEPGEEEPVAIDDCHHEAEESFDARARGPQGGGSCSRARAWPCARDRAGVGRVVIRGACQAISSREGEPSGGQFVTREIPRKAEQVVREADSEGGAERRRAAWPEQLPASIPSDG